MLKAKEVENFKPKEKPYKESDGRGLYVLVTPSGSKLFHLRYTFEGRERLMAMGAIGLADARRRAEDARAEIRAGRDPLAAKIAVKAQRKVAADNSFESVARGWHKDWSERLNISPRHSADTLRRLENNVFPILGAKPVSEIDASMVADMALRIERDGDRTEMARRMIEASGQIFAFAIKEKFCHHNPARMVKPGEILRRHEVTNYARIDGRDLGKLLRDIDNYKGTPLTRHALRLMTLTFVRTAELIGARWSEIDFDGMRWDIPAERMKMKSPHIVPLSLQAVNVLRLIHELTGQGELLFPGDRKNATMSNVTLLKALERMGYKGTMTGHGFRGLASTILHEQGYESDHIEAQLAHQKRNKVSAAYNHAKYLIPRREMMQKWADFCDGERDQRGQVLEMRTA